MSSMADLTSALGGALPDAGGGAAPPDEVDPTAAPDPSSGSPGYTNSMDALDGAEEALHAFIQLDPDEADRAAGAKLLQGVLQLKAGNQSANQSGDLKSLARALGAGPQPAGAGAAATGSGPGGY